MGGYGPLQAKFWRVKTEVPGRFQGLGPLKKILQKKCYRMVPAKVKLGGHIPGFAVVAYLPRLVRGKDEYTG